MIIIYECVACGLVALIAATLPCRACVVFLVLKFNENVTFGLPDNTPFTDQTAQLEGALSRIAADGETAFYDAMAAALEHLKKGNRDKKVRIVVSDGGDNASKHNLAQIMAMAGQSDAIIYTIGLFDEDDPDRNSHVLKQLAKDTGGEAFLPESLRDVVPLCERIARDIRNQYTVAYLPLNRKQGGARDHIPPFPGHHLACNGIDEGGLDFSHRCGQRRAGPSLAAAIFPPRSAKH
jgi:VWFA-related protein